MEAFLGKFNRTSEEGYDNFLTALNLNYLLRSHMVIIATMILMMILMIVMMTLMMILMMILIVTFQS